MSHLRSDLNVMSKKSLSNCPIGKPILSNIDDILLYPRSHYWHNIFKVITNSTKSRLSKNNTCRFIDSMSSYHPHHMHLMYSHNKRHSSTI